MQRRSALVAAWVAVSLMAASTARADSPADGGSAGSGGDAATAVVVASPDAPGAPSDSAAFPSDTPAVRDGRIDVFEVDLYGGPSLANGGQGGGVGFTGQIQSNSTWDTGLASQLSLSVTGGVYGVGSDGPASGIINVGPEMDVGYWNPGSVVDGVGAHVMLSYLNGSANIIGGSGALFSYTPQLIVGLHGRDASRASPWNVSLGLGASVGYGTGTMQKLDLATGEAEHWIIDPYASLSASTDQRLGPTYLRVGLSLSDRDDSLGPAGSRQVLNGSGYAWFKIFTRYYTGPSLTFSDPQRRADPLTRSYLDAAPVLAASWYFGGTL